MKTEVHRGYQLCPQQLGPSRVQYQVEKDGAPVFTTPGSPSVTEQRALARAWADYAEDGGSNLVHPHGGKLVLLWRGVGGAFVYVCERTGTVLWEQEGVGTPEKALQAAVDWIDRYHGKSGVGSSSPPSVPTEKPVNRSSAKTRQPDLFSGAQQMPLF